MIQTKRGRAVPTQGRRLLSESEGEREFTRQNSRQVETGDLGRKKEHVEDMRHKGQKHYFENGK